MSFLYCNKCFRLKPDYPSMALNLSECGHIQCTKCVKTKCAVFRRPFQVHKMSNKMSASVAIYFEDRTKIFHCYQKVVKGQMEQVALFYHNPVQKTPLKLRKIFVRKRP